MKEIKINNNPAVFITDEGYEALLHLLKVNSVCRNCSRLYTDSNPKISLNYCLECYTKTNRSLHFVKIERDDASGEERALFLDPYGYIEYTNCNSADPTPFRRRSIARTLEYWGFPLPPNVIMVQSREITVEPYWHIFGDIQTANVLVLYYEHYDGTSPGKPHPVVAYLTYKDGRLILVNENQEDMQVMFKKIREELEATKDDRGYYRPKKPREWHRNRYYTTSIMRNEDIYRYFADEVNEAYTQATSPTLEIDPS